jgi:hypothetical protein
MLFLVQLIFLGEILTTSSSSRLVPSIDHRPLGPAVAGIQAGERAARARAAETNDDDGDTMPRGLRPPASSVRPSLAPSTTTNQDG